MTGFGMRQPGRNPLQLFLGLVRSGLEPRAAGGAVPSIAFRQRSNASMGASAGCAMARTWPGWRLPRRAGSRNLGCDGAGAGASVKFSRGAIDGDEQAFSLQRLVSRGLGPRDRAQAHAPGRSATRTSSSTAAPTARVAALEDACWHRLLPLSLGRLAGDEIVCGYHGLVFNSAGRCTHHAGAEDDQSFGLRARLSGRRAASPRLGLAGRSGACRSRAHARFPLERRAEWKGEGGTFV